MGCNEINLLTRALGKRLRETRECFEHETPAVAQLLDEAAAMIDQLALAAQSLEGRLNNMEINVKISCENLRATVKIADGYLEALKKERNAALDALLELRMFMTKEQYQAWCGPIEFFLGAREQERDAARAKLLEDLVPKERPERSAT